MEAGIIENCPNKKNHTPCPDGYVAWHEWAKKKSKHHYQVACKGCGRLTIWKRKKMTMYNRIRGSR